MKWTDRSHLGEDAVERGNPVLLVQEQDNFGLLFFARGLYFSSRSTVGSG